MKKSILGIFAGLCLGIMLMLGVISVLNMKPDNEEIMAQNKDTSVSESFRDESEWVDDVVTEDVMTEITESDEIVSEEPESEKQPQKVTSTQKKPVDYPYYIRVNRQANCVTIYKKDAAGNYTVPVKAMTCSVGLTGETPLGVTKITARYLWRPLFGGTYGQYTVRFNGHILFHSVPYTQTTKDSLMEGQFNMLGQPASQGCVRLSAIDAKWIYDNCKNGTKVEVYDSPDPGPLGKPVTYQIGANSPYRGWDPTDPDPANPWKKGVVTIAGVKNLTVNQGDNVNLLAGVSATDVDGLSLEVTVSNVVDINVPGVYTVTYSATGVLGMTATATATVTVNAVEPEAPEEPEVPEDPEVPDVPEEPDDTELPNDTEEIGATQEVEEVQELELEQAA